LGGYTLSKTTTGEVAIQALQKAVEREPDNALLRVNLERLQRESGG
jgi:hypothetical protein